MPGPERPEEKKDPFTPTGELTGGYDVAEARANALAHAKKTQGEYVGSGKARRPLLWNVDKEGWDESADCFVVILSAYPDGAQVQQKGVWEYHARHDGSLLPGTPLLRQTMRYKAGSNWVAVTAIATVALAIIGLLVWLYPRNGPQPGTPTPVVPPATATPRPTPGFYDDFSGPLLWRKEEPEGDPRVLWPDNPPRPPGVSGQVAIENGELSVSADYWWYAVWAVRDEAEVSGDFEASVRFRIMPDDKGDSTKGSLQLRGAAQTVTLVWDGLIKRWIVQVPGTETRVAGPAVTKGAWVKVTIRRVGNAYQFEVNGSLVHQETRTDTVKVSYMALGSSVGTHVEGGTHVHFDDAVFR